MLNVTDIYGFIRQGVASSGVAGATDNLMSAEEEKKADDDADDFEQRFFERRREAGAGTVQAHSQVGYRKQDKLNARTDAQVTSFNFVKGSLKVMSSTTPKSKQERIA